MIVFFKRLKFWAAQALPTAKNWEPLTTTSYKQKSNITLLVPYRVQSKYILFRLLCYSLESHHCLNKKEISFSTSISVECNHLLVLLKWSTLLSSIIGSRSSLTISTSIWWKMQLLNCGFIKDINKVQIKSPKQMQTFRHEKLKLNDTALLS